MKTMNMISRRSFLKVAMAAATVSALGLTGCGSSASGTASGTASSAAASSAAASEAGQTFKVGIVNYVDHASLNQIVESVESRLDEVAKEKGVTFTYDDAVAAYLANKSYSLTYGARNLRRTIQKELEDVIATRIIDSSDHPVTQLRAVMKDGAIDLLSL